MTDDIGFTFLALLFVLLNAFFVATEFAIVKLRYTRAEQLAAMHGLVGRVLLKVRSNLDACLSACQLGITGASLGLGWIGEPAFARLVQPALLMLDVGSPAVLHGVAFAVAFAIISFLHIVLGELAPKSVAIRKPEPVSLWAAVPLYGFYWLMYPFIRVLNGSANLLLETMGLDLSGVEDEAHSREEIKKVLLASHLHGELNRESADLLARAMELEALTAGDLMRPGRELVALDIRDDFAAKLARMRKYRYSRYPVYDGVPDSVIGILHFKDLIDALAEPGVPRDLRPLLKPALLIDEFEPAMAILERFRKGSPHFAIVMGEHRTVEGFITLEHILDALLGTIQDEFRHRKPTWSFEGDGTVVGSGSLSVYSLERVLELEIDDRDTNSVGGLVIKKLERIPQTGDVAEFGNFSIEVRQMRGPRIAKVAVRRHLEAA
jgi:CBS domain containing-hemolysin-like protein